MAVNTMHFSGMFAVKKKRPGTNARVKTADPQKHRSLSSLIAPPIFIPIKFKEITGLETIPSSPVPPAKTDTSNN
jgi:hypothetical protein